MNVGSGGGTAAAPAAGGAGAAAGGAAEEAPKEEEKEEGEFTSLQWLADGFMLTIGYREGGVRRGHGLWSVRLSNLQGSEREGGLKRLVGLTDGAYRASRCSRSFASTLAAHAAVTRPMSDPQSHFCHRDRFILPIATYSTTSYALRRISFRSMQRHPKCLASPPNGAMRMPHSTHQTPKMPLHCAMQCK